MSIPLRLVALMLWSAFASYAYAMSYTSEVVNGKTCDVVSWTDANGKARSVALVRANGDVGSYKGGYIERYTYFIGDTQKTGVSNEGQAFVSGLGCVVNHYGSTAASSKASTTGATTAFLLQGANHCIWRFSGAYNPGGNVGLKLDYLIREGVNDIIWAVSFDSSGVANNAVNADARGPYVQWDWDGDNHFYDGAIAGIRWGDKYRFRTVNYVYGNPGATTWDYSQTNIIPYMAINKSVAQGDIEVGAVQTQSWAQQDAGGYWWSSHWGTSGTGMPENWNCPYQLNGYENYSSEKLAWGTNFGYVGSSAYDELGFGAKRVGWPHQGYSVALVVDRFSTGHLDALVGSMEAAQVTTATASIGTVVTSGARHLDLSGNANYQPAGWNHVYGAWSFTATGNDLTANFNVAAGKTLVRPLIALGSYTASSLPAVVRFNGATLTAGTDYAATLDDAGDRLWLTLARSVSGASNTLMIADTAGTGTTVPTLTWPAPAGITYGAVLGGTQLNASANVPGTFSYTPTSGTRLHAGAGQVLSVTFTPNDTATYAVTSTTTTISVAKAALTIRADDKTRNEGAANPTLTATYTGFVAGEGPGVLDTPATLSTTANDASPVGSYPITVSGVSDGDYTPTYQAGTLTVQAAGTAPPTSGGSSSSSGGCGMGGGLTVLLLVLAGLITSLIRRVH